MPCLLIIGEAVFLTQFFNESNVYSMKNIATLSGLSAEQFDGQIDNKEIRLYILSNQRGAEITALNYGARIVSLVVPDRNGKGVDVVTGHSSLTDYIKSEEPYFGAICGRYANRIAAGRFDIDGITYDKLPINNGPNSLHGGLKGFNSVVWDVVNHNESSIEFTYKAADGEEGYPGNLSVSVTYQLTDDNEVVITYSASTDSPTVVNLTNHAYFNLSGAGAPTIGDHLLTIHADYYLPTDETLIPLGSKAEVEGTPMDFRTPHAVGERIDSDFLPLKIGRGYDHTYIIRYSGDGQLVPCALCSSPVTGITMEALTTEPGVQLYTGNWMTGNLEGKHGRRYPARAALCLETQHYPNSPNEPSFPSTLLRPGQSFESKTVFKFTTI
jgi:aldose 1-epimerase